MTEMVQANARVPEAARPVLLGVAARLRDDPGFLDRLQAFLADEAGGSPWADRIEAIEARLAALEGTGKGRPKVRQFGEANESERFSASIANATGRSERDVRRDGERPVSAPASDADWPARAAAITVSTGEGRERRLTTEGAALFEEMVKAGVRNPDIARVLGMARQSVDARAKKVLAASSIGM